MVVLRKALGNGPKSRIGRTGIAAERKLSTVMGGRLKPGSGATRGKGDFEVSKFLVEVKSTINESLGVKLQWLAKIAREAAMTGKKPALAVLFTDETGRPVQFGDWMMITRTEFEVLTDLAYGPKEED